MLKKNIYFDGQKYRGADSSSSQNKIKLLQSRSRGWKLPALFVHLSIPLISVFCLEDTTSTVAKVEEKCSLDCDGSHSRRWLTFLRRLPGQLVSCAKLSSSLAALQRRSWWGPARRGWGRECQDRRQSRGGACCTADRRIQLPHAVPYLWARLHEAVLPSFPCMKMHVGSDDPCECMGIFMCGKEIGAPMLPRINANIHSFLVMSNVIVLLFE